MVAIEVQVTEVPSVTAAVCQQIISEIAQKTDDAFYLMDSSDIAVKYQHWVDQLPQVQPFYAVKCNNHPFVLQLLADLGCNFDCASAAEIKAVLDVGVDPERVIFANPCKSPSHLRYAVSRGVDLMTFDNISELHKINQLCPLVRLVVRIRVDAQDAQYSLGAKFGVAPDQVAPLLQLAAALQLNLVGVSFHVGSGCREPAVFQRAIRAASGVFDAAAELGFSLQLLDIGGGFLGAACQDLNAPALYIRQALDTYFPCDSGVRVIAEPGRYMVHSAFQLATQIVSVRREAHNLFYYVNDGVYGSFCEALYDRQMYSPAHLLPLQRPDGDKSDVTDDRSGEWPPVTVFGPTCDSLDRIRDQVRLSPALTVGDWLVWRDMGAYTLSVAGDFNGFPRSTVRAVVTDQRCGRLRSAFDNLLNR